MDDIPPLVNPADLPPIRTQEELHRLWRMLMGPLGFGDRSLWLHLLDADGRSSPVLVQVDELPVLPDATMRRQLERFVRELVAHSGGDSVAFLLTRPGRSGLTPADRSWAEALSEVVRRVGLRPWPVHRANDHELVVVAPDDLAASA